MKKFTVPAIAALMALGANFAWAADITGVIKTINANTHEIVLEDGKAYQVANSVDLKDLKTGDKVTITAEVENGKNMASRVTKS
jgi:Cu/Ag efflux protein CusF